MLSVSATFYAIFCLIFISQCGIQRCCSEASLEKRRNGFWFQEIQKNTTITCKIREQHPWKEKTELVNEKKSRTPKSEQNTNWSILPILQGKWIKGEIGKKYCLTYNKVVEVEGASGDHLVHSPAKSRGNESRLLRILFNKSSEYVQGQTPPLQQTTCSSIWSPMQWKSFFLHFH